MDNFENEVVEEVVETEVEEAVVEINEAEETEVVEETETEETSTSEEAEETEEVAETETDFEETTVEEKFTKTFTVELSHDDIRWALYNLIAQYDEEDNDYYGIRAVYDNYFIMCGWVNNKLYKVGYSVDGENVSLDGERQEVFELIVTESEKIAIEKMRENYADLEAKYNALKEFKDNYDASELKAQKDAIFEKAEYAILSDEDEFKSLIADADKFSVEEIEAKAKSIFADHVIKTGTFSAKVVETKSAQTIGLNFNAKGKKSGPYGNLFNKD